MPDRENHCPFLNRADARCSNHFSLDRLDKAMEDCFGQYHCCATYAELLIERRVRRASERVLIGGDRHHAQPPFVELRVPRERYAKSIA